MKWHVLVNDRAVEIDPEHLEAVAEVEPGVYSVVRDGQSFEVRIIPGEDGWQAEVNGRRLAVEVVDPRNTSRRSRSSLGAGRQNIAAPMPGKVIRVLVGEGDAVEPRQGLVVVEAMKMQNELRASHAGRVAEVKVRDGETVTAGQTLVVLE